MQHGNAMTQLHHHLHVVLDNQDGKVLGDPPHQLFGVFGFGLAHPRGWLVEAKKFRLGGERNADFERALIAMRQIGSEFPRFAEEPHCLERLFRLLIDIGKRVVVRNHVP